MMQGRDAVEYACYFAAMLKKMPIDLPRIDAQMHIVYTIVCIVLFYVYCKFSIELSTL